jgi:two-component system, cell cycle sensor histidine kinase and response regulator CckA
VTEGKPGRPGKVRKHQGIDLSTILEGIGEAVVAAAADGSTLFLNASAERLTGWSMDEALGENVQEIVRIRCGETGAFAGNPLDRAMRENGAVVSDDGFLLVSRDGGEKRGAFSAKPLRDASGAVTGAVFVFQERTSPSPGLEASRESASNLRIVLESTADGILAVTNEGEVLWSNSRFGEIWHIPEELRLFRNNRDLIAFVLPQLVDPDGFLEKLGRFYGTDKIGIDEIEFKDGRVVERFSCPLLRNGRNTGRLWSFRDITARRRAEGALLESEGRYRELTDNLPIGIYRNTPGPSGRFIMANSALARLLGLDSVDELISHQVAGLYTDPRQREIISAELTEKGLVVDREVELRRKDGSSFWAAITAHAVRDAEGNVVHFDGSVVDITRRKKAELENEERHQRLLSIFDGIDEPIYVSDPLTHEVLYVNQVSRSNWGDPAGKRCFEYLQNRREPCPFCTNDRILGEWLGRSYVWEFQNEINHHWYKCIDKAIPWPDGRMVRYEMAVDISERKKAELEREVLEAELRQSQKIEAVGRLAGGVAHDFNNMLQVINTYARLALERLDPSDPLYTQISEISKAGVRSADLVQQLLAFARKQTIAPRLLDLNQAVPALLTMLRRMIGEDIELQWLPEDGLWSVLMDPAQIDQILINLVINSRDAIGTSGRVVVETANVQFDESSCTGRTGCKPGDYVRLTVRDNGCGMGVDLIDCLFEPFFTTKEVGRGTGLGLSTVYGIVRQNMGFIEVESAPGQGSVFRIFLPRHVSDTVRADSPKPPEVRTGSETILVVEDEDVVLGLIRTMLDILGYSVLTAGDPAEALALAGAYAGEIHLLLSDVVMPGIGCRELWRQLLLKRPGMKCLFMSGYTANAITHRGILDEGIRFIQKPFSMEELSTRVREALGAPDAPVPDQT